MLRHRTGDKIVQARWWYKGKLTREDAISSDTNPPSTSHRSKLVLLPVNITQPYLQHTNHVFANASLVRYRSLERLRQIHGS